MAKTATNTKEKLLDVAQILIQRHGINGMSFQDLSDAVGIRKASVHHHFANKADMIQALSERQLSNFNNALQSILVSRANGKTKLKRYCDLFVDTLKVGKQDRNCLFGMLMAEVLSVDHATQGQICAFMQSNIAFIEKVLAEGMNDGSLRKTRSLKNTARMIFSTMEGGLLVARCSGGPKQLAETSTQLVNLLSA